MSERALLNKLYFIFYTIIAIVSTSLLLILIIIDLLQRLVGTEFLLDVAFPIEGLIFMMLGLTFIWGVWVIMYKNPNPRYRKPYNKFEYENYNPDTQSNQIYQSKNNSETENIHTDTNHITYPNNKNNLRIKHPMIYWDLTKNSIEELVSASFPTFDSTINEAYILSLSRGIKVGKQTLSKLFLNQVIILFFFAIIMSFSNSFWFKSTGNQLVIILGTVIYYFLSIKSFGRQVNKENKLIGVNILPYERTIFLNNFVNVAIYHSNYMLIIALYYYYESLAAVALTLFLIVYLIGSSRVMQKVKVANLYPVELFDGNKKVVILLSPSRNNYYEIYSLSKQNYWIGTTRAIELIVNSAGLKRTITMIEYHLSSSKKSWKVRKQGLLLRYLVFPLIILGLLKVIFDYILVNQKAEVYLLAIFALFLFEMNYYISGALHVKYSRDLSVKNLRRIVDHKLFSNEIIRLSVIIQSEHLNSMPLVKASLKSHYWQYRSGVYAGSDIMKLNDKIESIIKESK